MACEPADDDWLAIAQGVIDEALKMCGRENDIALIAVAARVWEHFLDRWYRFAPFGVTSPRDLEPIAMEAKASPFEHDDVGHIAVEAY